jgi:Integrase core domain
VPPLPAGALKNVGHRVTCYTVFVMDLGSRRVHILGSRPHPNDVFMSLIVRLVTAADDGVLIGLGHRVLICDRDRKWSCAVRQRLGDAGIRVVLTPERAPNANAHAERFVRSIKDECLDRMIPLGERHFRRAIMEFVEHYHLERNHQGLDNRLIAGTPATNTAGSVRRRSRLGGLLSYYERAA